MGERKVKKIKESGAKSLTGKRRLILWLSDGDLKEIRFNTFPATYQWGRSGSTPLTYELNGPTHRKGKLYYQIRREGNPEDPFMTLSPDDSESILKQIDNKADQKDIKKRLDNLYRGVKEKIMLEVAQILTAFDQDHSKSETLAAQQEEGFNWTTIFVLAFGILIGYVISTIAVKG